MDISKNSIWLTYHDISQLEHLRQFIPEWSEILDRKKGSDLKEIDCCKDEEYGECYVFLAEKYNHLYAHFLITIYSALEYDLRCLAHLDMYSFKKFCTFLRKSNIKFKKIKNKNEIDLLRLYCNAYKHNNGFYTAELIKKQKTQKIGDEIQYSNLNILEQYYLAYEFLWDLYAKLGIKNGCNCFNPHRSCDLVDYRK